VIDHPQKEKCERFREAANRLSGDRNFREFMEWIEFNMRREDHDNRHQSDPVRLHMGQGRAQILSEILEHPNLKPTGL
jgi:hypothetical protein